VKTPNPHGRVDVAANRVFDTLLVRHGNPTLRFACAVFADDIAKCFEQHLGPGTGAHKIGQQMIRLVEGRRKCS
jgi:hypothetical protein